MDSNRIETDEQRFLHDIASPITTAGLLASMLQENFQQDPGTKEADLKCLTDLIDMLQRAEDMIKDRRQRLTTEANRARS